MKLTAKRNLVAAAVVVTSLVLAGCAGAAPDSKGPVTITLESWTPAKDVANKIVATFEKQNPDIKVKVKLLPYADYVTAIKTELASNTGPDVFDLQTGGMLNEFAPLLSPLDKLAAAQLGKGWKSAYKQSTLDQSSVKGAVYGLPHGFQPAGLLWVNKTLLDANGIAIPETMSQLVTASQKLRSAGVVPVAIGAKDDWMLIDIFSSMSNAIAPGTQYAAMNGKGSWKKPGLIKAFNEFASMFTDGVAQNGAAGAATYTDTYDLFADGKAAFFTNGGWNQDMYVGAADRIGKFESSVTLMPTSAGPAPVTAGISALLAVNSKSKQQEAAFKLAHFMSAEQGQQIVMDGSLDFSVTSKDLVPGIKVNKNAEEVRTALTTMLKEHLAGYREVPNAAVKAALGQALLKLVAGSIDGAEAAAEVQTAADAH